MTEGGWPPVTEAVRANAANALRGVTADPERPGEVWWVRSLHGPSRYRVQRYESGAVDCTCPHGAYVPGTGGCYHIEAARMFQANQQK